MEREAIDPANRGARAEPRSRALVLVVDDNEPARYAKGRTLTDQGFRIVEASTGPDAIEAAERWRPDVIVLDVGLPGFDGIEVCRRLKRAPDTKGIPVVQVSASFVQDTDRVRALEGGADTYLTEPIDPRVLVATVNAMLRVTVAEAAVRRSEARFRAMADSAPAMIWVSDPEGATTWLNRRWFEFTGVARGEDVETARWSRMHPEDVEAARRELRDALAARRELSMEYRVRRADGDYRWLLDHSLPLYDGHELAGLIGSCIDITERRSSEEARRLMLDSEHRARTESERLNQVKDDFLATLGHELRTPLNAILGWAQVVRSTTPSREETLDAIERIERNARAQARIIDDLLDMSRIVSGKVRLSMRRFALADTLAAAVDSIAPAAGEKSIRVVVEGEHDDWNVHGDADRVQQVFWNLLQNAIKFSPSGGEVRVIARRAGKFAEVDVVDRGQGIDPTFLPHVFERFRQADGSTTRKQAGLGLGLAIVKHIVELHGGTVRAESEGLGKGATFHVRLPLVDRAAIDDSESDHGRLAHTTTAALEGARVLVVEDEADSRELLRSVLGRHGARVAVAQSAAEAIAHFERERPDVIVSDVGMPGVDGYGMLRRMREIEGASSRTPAIALTAFARADDRERALRAGFQRHMGKPVMTDELVEAVVELVEDAKRS